jgi:hypothetical protein
MSAWSKRETIMVSLHIPTNVWIECHNDEKDAVDVIVEMEDGAIYTAMFVTIPYLQYQMSLSYEVSKQLPDTPAVRYAALETTHILVESLDRDTIEDTIDNLLALDVFEGLFTRVTEDPEEIQTSTRTTNPGKRATAEVAAVVLSDVLVIEG